MYLLHSSTDGRNASLRVEGRDLENHQRGNEYQKEIDDLKRLVGDQALVIDALKKSRQGRK